MLKSDRYDSKNYTKNEPFLGAMKHSEYLNKNTTIDASTKGIKVSPTRIPDFRKVFTLIFIGSKYITKEISTI